MHALFFLSGLCGLGYQLIWTRVWGLVLGQEMAAVLGVVAAMFLGFAIGAWGLARHVAAGRRPALWYAGLEAVIGCWSLLLGCFLPFIQSRLVLHADFGPVAHGLASLGCVCVVLLPATAAMGATLPVMQRWAATHLAEPRTVGGLYAANTLGALAGVVATTFVVAPRIGFRATILLLAALNLVCAGVAWFLARAPARSGAAASTSSRHGSRNAICVWLFTSGLLGLGYEVLGVRVLSQYLENTVYTFAAALAVFLLGTALGAALYQRWGRRVEEGMLQNGLAMALAVSAALGAAISNWLGIAYESLRVRFPRTLAGMVGAEVTLSAGLFLVPTLLMGALFALLADRLRHDPAGLSRAVGWNAAGAGLAPLVFAAGCVPLIGTPAALALVCVGYLTLLRVGDKRLLGIAVALAGLILAGLYWVPEPASTERILERRETAMERVEVIGHADNHRSLRVNGRFNMGGTGATAAQRRHVHLPVLLHPAAGAGPGRLLFLGVGTGISFGALAQHGDWRGDGVELSAGVTELLPSFAPHNLSERWPPRLKLHVADARRFARSVREPYDVIVADLFHPARDGAGALYTREHFRALRSCLAPGGLLCQWLPLYQLDGPALRSILRAFLDVFPDAHAVLLRVTLDTPVLGLVSGLAPGRYGADWFERRVGDPVLREALRQTGLASGMQLLGSLLAAPSALDAYCRDAPMNTDDRPLVLFEAPRLHATRPGPSHAAVLLELLALGGAGCDRLLASGDEPANRGFRLRFNAYIEARTLYVRGLVAEAEKRTAAAVDAFVESTRRSGDFTTGYAHVLNLAARRWAGAPTEAARWLERLIEARPERPVAGELLRRLRASAGGTGAPVALETPQP